MYSSRTNHAKAGEPVTSRPGKAILRGRLCHATILGLTVPSHSYKMRDATVLRTSFNSGPFICQPKVIRPGKSLREFGADSLVNVWAQNPVPPSSSNQPIVKERETPEPTSGNQASAGNGASVEKDLIKQLAELKDKDESFSDYYKRWRTKLFMLQTRPKDQELIRIFSRSLLPYFNERMLAQTLTDFSLVQRAGLNIEELYNEEKKKSRGFDSGKITKPSERNKPSTWNNPLPQYQYDYPPHESPTGGSINAIGSNLPEELILAEA
ncbi:hypothetical protein JCGZ_19538 [Jatropha curcas]|uniref:Retrotransposon gag domain-containing protein n=1 Tax=Jatropha curcas TaxID=180498 RepID=A0A067K1Q2_JATCU|nr:hypothetical protein JCGZ_19538 [Jatropha curcas]